MKCLECIRLGKKSTVTPHECSVTLAYYTPYYDEEGIYHHHDKNTHTQQFTCSNNHRWETKSHGICSCGWGKDQEITIRRL